MRASAFTGWLGISSRFKMFAILVDMSQKFLNSVQVLYRRLGFVGSPMKPMRLKLKRKE